jgi:hypothetical protein
VYCPGTSNKGGVPVAGRFAQHRIDQENPFILTCSLPAEAADEVVRVVEVVNTWKMHFVQVGVSPRDIENLAQQIDGDYLLQQRTSFEPGRFVLLQSKRPRKGPFSAV